MVSIFQQFEFAYPNGELFFDRSGALSRRLCDLFPGLAAKDAVFNQREYSVSEQNLHLLFGVAVSRMQSFAVQDKDFAHKAAIFLEEICAALEIDTLNRFSFRHVLGKACSTFAQAQELMWPLIGEEQKAKMASLSPLPSWSAIQGEFTHGAFAFESRIAVMKLIPDLSVKIGDHLLEKMLKIVFPSIQFASVSIEEAVEYLNVKSRDLDAFEKDPKRRGVQIELDSDAGSADVQLSLDLRDIPMMEALRYIVELAGLNFKLAPDRVLVVDRSDIGSLPHITCHLQATGQEPISIADFDVAAFIRNFRDKHSQEILSKLAPHLAEV